MRIFVLLLAAGALAGCRTEAVAARIVDSTDDGRSELARVVESALERTDVVLDADAFGGDGTLVVERVRHVDAQGRRLAGRETEAPAHFRALLVDGACWIEHVESRRRWRLDYARCEPLAAPPPG